MGYPNIGYDAGVQRPPTEKKSPTPLKRLASVPDRSTVQALLCLSVSRPGEFWDRLVNRFQRGGATGAAVPMPDTSDPVGAVHCLLESDSDDSCASRAGRLLESIRCRLPREHHNDGSPVLGFLLATIIWHSMPDRVVETGVARGISSAHILSALQDNKAGHLWSIDLPPLRPEWFEQSCSAVSPGMRDRWTYLRGASRRHLPRLLAEIDPIDIFVHDSEHTRKNMLWEMMTAWPSIKPGGFLICDDVYANDAFYRFCSVSGVEGVTIQDDGTGDIIGIARKPFLR